MSTNHQTPKTPICNPAKTLFVVSCSSVYTFKLCDFSVLPDFEWVLKNHICLNRKILSPVERADRMTSYCRGGRSPPNVHLPEIEHLEAPAGLCGAGKIAISR